MQRDFDIAHWLRLDPFLDKARLVDNDLLSTLLGLGKDGLKDNYVNSFIHFQQGKIEGETYFRLKKAVTNDLQLLFRDKVKTDFNKYMPGEDLGMMMAAAMNLKGINQLLIEKHVKGAGMQKMKELGLSFDDLVQAFTGEIAVGIYDRPEHEAVPLVVLPIDDKASFASLLAVALESQLLQSARG